MSNVHYVRCVRNDGYEIDLTVGQVYRSLPLTDVEMEAGVLRIFDNEGEDYLYDASYFEPFQPDGPDSELSASLTIQLDAFTKGVLHAEARAANRTMSALVREWIVQHLGLAAQQEQDWSTTRDTRSVNQSVGGRYDETEEEVSAVLA